MRGGGGGGSRGAYQSFSLLAFAIPPAIFAKPLIARAWVSISSTSFTDVPLPLATRNARLFRPVGMPWSIFIYSRP